MCDHIECHGGKMRVYREEYETVSPPGRKTAVWCAGFPDGWFPVHEGPTWADAMEAAALHIKDGG